MSVLSCLKRKILIGNTKMCSFKTKNDSFKVAVISDTQLPTTQEELNKDDKYLQNLKKALTVIKNNSVDMIMFAGDIGDLGTCFAFQTYKDAIDDVFGNHKPIIQTIMGNHDFWDKDECNTINHIKAFKNIMSQSPWTHYVVNGYHFIGASPNNGSMDEGYKITSKWLDGELKKAYEQSDGKPIFVMTHNQPKDTCYGSDDWGDTSLNAVMGKYPNIVNLSGHSHYSILDERSIWQDGYTVMSTQSLSYTELEKGKENGSIPPNADATPMGYIMEFNEEHITIHRMNFADGNMGYEEKQNNVWCFDLPYVNDGKYSFNSRKEKNTAPVMNNATGTAKIENNKIVLSFEGGTDDDFVHSYKVVTDGTNIKYFFSDFYNGIENMKKTVELHLENDNKMHSFEVFAVDSWGMESKECVKIEQI